MKPSILILFLLLPLFLSAQENFREPFIEVTGTARLGNLILLTRPTIEPRLVDDPDWLGRDRFVLSAGHASMLLYSLLYLSGYEVSLEEPMAYSSMLHLPSSTAPAEPNCSITCAS